MEADGLQESSISPKDGIRGRNVAWSRLPRRSCPNLWEKVPKVGTTRTPGSTYPIISIIHQWISTPLENKRHLDKHTDKHIASSQGGKVDTTTDWDRVPGEATGRRHR